MKSYDDLQRFKEKTQTNHIDFKDMSEQTLNADTTNWAVIKQLLNDGAGSVLDNSQHIGQAAPQPVGPAAFTPPPAASQAPTSHLQTQSFVATTPADRVGSTLLDSISASLPSGAAPAAVEPVAVTAASPAIAGDHVPLRAMPVAQQTAIAGSTLLAQLAASSPPSPVAQPAAPVYQAPAVSQAPVAAPAPVITPRSSPVDAAPEVSYKQLFSTAASPSSAPLSKDMLLQPLLEKIASCR